MSSPYAQALSQEDFASVLGGKNALATVSTLVLGFVVALESAKVASFDADMQNKDSLRIIGVVGSITCCALSTGMVMVASLGFSFQGYFGTDFMAYNLEAAKAFIYCPAILRISHVCKDCLTWGTLLFGIGLAFEALAAITFSGIADESDAPSIETTTRPWLLHAAVCCICTLSPLLASAYIFYFWRLMQGMRTTFMDMLHQSSDAQYEEQMRPLTRQERRMNNEPTGPQEPLMGGTSSPPVETSSQPQGVEKKEWQKQQIGSAVVVTFPSGEAKQNRLGTISSQPDMEFDCLVKMFDGSKEVKEIVNYEQLFVGLNKETRVHVGDKIGCVTTAETNLFDEDQCSSVQRKLGEYSSHDNFPLWEQEFILKTEGSKQKCCAKYSDITHIDTTGLKKPYVDTTGQGKGQYGY